MVINIVRNVPAITRWDKNIVEIKSAIFSSCKDVHSTKFTQVIHSAT